MKRSKKRKKVPRTIKTRSSKLVKIEHNNNQVIEDLEKLLICSLALYVTLESTKPIRTVLDQLFKIEHTSAYLVNRLINTNKKNLSFPISLKNSMAGIFSYIQFPAVSAQKSKNKSII